ncbi:PucR family transcriptional regulator [Gordonia asplenii]|nr:PucR family transcriptional regulator [Gordonia asplenii]
MTVRQLAARTKLGLSIVAGSSGAGRTVSWAHAIELLDPTPWLSGGELVMTTGIALPDDVAGQRDYVYRLADAGVAALAIDTGTTLRDIPQAIIDAADDRDFTVLRVPAQTPFIAVSRTVIDDLAADQLRTVQEVVDGQELLARAAARGGLTVLVETLSNRLAASVCVVDRSGGQIARSGELTDLRRRVVERLDAESGRIGGARVLAEDRWIITINPLPATGDPHGYLAVASPTALDAAGRLLVGHAVSLLSLEMAKPTGILDAESRLRTAALALLRSGGELDRRLSQQLGFPNDPQVVVVFVAAGALSADVVREVIQRPVDTAGDPYLLETLDDGVALVVSSDAADRISAATADAAQRGLSRRVRIGISRPTMLSTVRTVVGQARAAAHARDEVGARPAHIDDIGTLALLLGQPAESRSALITSSGLQSLIDYDAANATTLVTTLHAYLRYGGQWDTSANSLGIHRHTMRNRIRKISEVTGHDVDDAQHRSELWLALQARELE